MYIDLCLHFFKVGFHHFCNQVLEGGCRCPAKTILSFGWISKKKFYFCWTEILRINLDKLSSFVCSVYTNFFNGSSRSLPDNNCSNSGKCLFYEFSDSVCFSCSKYKVIWLVLLKHHPHTFYVITSMSPITLCINITKVQ